MFPIAAATLHHVDPYHLTAIRYGLAVPVFLVLLAAVEGRAALKPEGRSLELFVLGSVGFAGFNLLGYVGIEHTRPQEASLVAALMPLLTVLATWALTRRAPGRATLTGIAIAFAGVALVITRGDPSNAIHGGGLSGDGMILVGALGWVAYTLGARRFAGFSPLRYTALSAAGGSRSRPCSRSRAPSRCRPGTPSARPGWSSSTSSRSPRCWPCSPGTRACAGSARRTPRCS
jgi:drug/metabolite transporter (DMT)-like permease